MKPPVAVLAVSSLVAVAPVSANATDEFAQQVWPHVNFLDQSSRLAVARSKSAKLRSFARSEAAEQTAFANALVAWLENRIIGQSSNGTAKRAARDTSLVAAPFRAASGVTGEVADAIDGLQTGRSVATNNDETRRRTNLTEVRLPSAHRNLDRLATVSGKAFDDLYKSTQRDALLQLSTIYASYIQDGRDAALKALSIRALPIINKRLAALGNL